MKATGFLISFFVAFFILPYLNCICVEQLNLSFVLNIYTQSLQKVHQYESKKCIANSQS